MTEINMSIDDSLILFNGSLNDVFRNEQIDLSDKQISENELNTTIELLNNKQSNLPNKNDLIDLERVDSVNQYIELVKSENDTKSDEVNDQKIQQVKLEEKQITQDETSQQTKTKVNIDELIRQVDRTQKMEKIITVQKVTDQSNGQTEQIVISNTDSTAILPVEKDDKADSKIDDHPPTLNDSQTIQLKLNVSTRSSNDVDMSVDDTSVLNDIRNIFETCKSPLKKMETPEHSKSRDVVEMDVSCAENDSLVLKEVKIENNPIDCLDESPYLKSLAPPKQVFKLSRKRLNCETESPIKKSHLSSNLFKNYLNTTPLISQAKKWRSATYNPMTSSPKKMEIASPLKSIDSNIVCSSINGKIDNLLFSNLNQMIQKSDQSPNLMGDYTSTYALPLIPGRHKDLKTISPETLSNLMNGEYRESISHFTIVDSRYPYEYEAGHIDGSKNIYHKEGVNKYFFGTDKPTLITDTNLIKSSIDKNWIQSSCNSMQRAQPKNSLNKNSIKRLSVIKEGENDENQLKVKPTNEQTNLANDITANSSPQKPIKRHAIIFHCEFSSERGPSMCRFLRKVDRELNESCYPNLYYPEIYLLHGGYKLFFEKFKNLCYPQTYLPMHHSDHKQDLIKFRTKSKSWTCERKWKSVSK